jgi:predicted NUDIX family phosphoesterase
MAEELVLVFPRQLLDTLGDFQGIQLDASCYIGSILDGRQTRFMLRSHAEENPGFKQIIPYVLIRQGDRWLHYVRGKGSGEKRLVAKGSIGVGGHINPEDQSLFDSGRDFYERAVQRELHEELRIDGEFHTRIVALLNDDSTPVGRVHLGVVHVCDLTDENVSRGEASLTELRFLSFQELQNRREQLESWSQFCLDHLEVLASVRRSAAS